MSLAIRLARQNLSNHKTRARLSTLGVVISVFIVSTIFIISDSIKFSLTEQANSLGKNTVIINGSTSSNILSVSINPPKDTLIDKDLSQIKSSINSDADVISNLVLDGTTKFEDNQIDHTTILSTSITDPKSLNLELNDGSWFSDREFDKKWVILGEDLANKLIGTNHPQNQIIDIKGEKYTVVGVLKKVNQPLSLLGYNVNQSAFISLKNGVSINESDTISQIILKNIGDDSGETRRKVDQILTNNHTDSSDYSIHLSSDIASRLTKIINYVTIAACSLSAVILLISCISIANIMLVNVAERRHEIGIRKAVGATTRNIINQFMAEALIMSLRGGIIGIILAYIFSAVFLLFTSISLTFSWMAILVGFIIPVIIGIVAGVYPAYRASRQDIIAALNQLT